MKKIIDSRKSAMRAVLNEIPEILEQAKHYLEKDDSKSANRLLQALFSPRPYLKSSDFFKILDSVNDVEWFPWFIHFEYSCKGENMRLLRHDFIQKSEINCMPRAYYVGKYVKTMSLSNSDYVVWVEVEAINTDVDESMHPMFDLCGTCVSKNSLEGQPVIFSRLMIVEVSCTLPAECVTQTLMKFSG